MRSGYSRPPKGLFVLKMFSELMVVSLVSNVSNYSRCNYSLVPIRRHGSINRHTSFIWPCTFSKIWGVTINWINTQFWSTSRGTFDKNNLAPIAYTFVGVSFNWIVTFSMPWGVTINWNMSSNWNQRVGWHWSSVIWILGNWRRYSIWFQLKEFKFLISHSPAYACQKT